MKIAASFLGLCTVAFAQQMTMPGGVINKSKTHVAFVNADQTVMAARPSLVTLHFTIDPGFHINSHTPRNATLIPTKIAVEDGEGFTVKTVDFPKGVDYSFALDPKEKLDVYTGEFTLTAHVTAKRGPHTIKALLHYQACDSASCYPPKVLPVEQRFDAK